MPTRDQRIGEYILEEPLGAGGFGEVWRARHHIWADQQVAVKIPKDPQYLRALQREGLAIQGLVHPNIVRAIGFDPYADPPYLVTEYVPGTSLRPLIAKRALSPKEAVAILRQVLAALGAAHHRGIVHRDVKAENILIHRRAGEDGFDAEGVVKLTDFGLGRIEAMSSVSMAHSRSIEEARGRDVAGTIEYMSPEQRSGGPLDGRADLYACGVVLFEMLTGEKPAGTDVPSDLNPAVPRHLDTAFRGSYARLDKRFDSAEAFANALGGNVAPLPAPLARTALRNCPTCQTVVGRDDQFCTQCGGQLVQQVRRCPKCRAFPDPADRFCLFCGESLIPTVKVTSNV